MLVYFKITETILANIVESIYWSDEVNSKLPPNLTAMGQVPLAGTLKICGNDGVL